MTSFAGVSAAFVFAAITLSWILVPAATVTVSSSDRMITFDQGASDHTNSSFNIAIGGPFTFCSGGTSSLLSTDSNFASGLCLPLPGIA